MHEAHDPISLFAPADPTAPLQAAQQMAEGVRATIRMARALVEGRRRVDLDGLDRMMGVLCARALDLPPEQGRAFRPHLVALGEELDALAAALVPP